MRHTPHTSPPFPDWLAQLGAVACVFALCLLASDPAHAQVRDLTSPASTLTHMPALTSFALTSDASPQLHVVLEQRTLIDPHKDLHIMCDDARRRLRKRHWVFPAIRDISRVVTHNGVVLVRPKPQQPLDATARIIPTLSLNTVGAKLRISF